MSVIQALLIHSFYVYTGEIVLASYFSSKFAYENDPSIISAYHALIIVTEQFQNP